MVAIAASRLNSSSPVAGCGAGAEGAAGAAAVVVGAVGTVGAGEDSDDDDDVDADADGAVSVATGFFVFAGFFFGAAPAFTATSATRERMPTPKEARRRMS